MSKKTFLAEIWPKTAMRGPEIFFPKKNFFEKNFFAQFSKLSHFDYKNAKKKFQSDSPLSDPGILPQKKFLNFSFFYK